MKTRLLLLIAVVVFSFATLVAMPLNAFANANDQKLVFDSGISDFNVSSGCPLPIGDSSAASSTSVAGGSTNLKLAIDTYGQTAMTMQKQYGTPWEVVFAQMQMESQVGTTGIAVQGAINNWLGITGSGDTGQSITIGSHTWAIFSSVNASILAWGGPKVARNGYYDKAFAYLDPNNYDLHGFIAAFIPVYAPSSDGNDVANYISTVESVITNQVEPEAKALGWPSSAEYAKQNNIPIGGQNPLGSAVSSQTATNDDSGCASGGGNGSINTTVINLAWGPKDSGWGGTAPNAAYQIALNQPNGVGTRKEGDSCSIGGYSCDAYVATVMRYSGLDSDYPCCGAANQLNYLSNSNLYTHVGSTATIHSTNQVQVGDIFNSGNHTWLILQTPDGAFHGAAASHCDHSAQLDQSGVWYLSAGSGYVDYTGVPFEIYRFNGGGS